LAENGVRQDFGHSWKYLAQIIPRTGSAPLPKIHQTKTRTGVADIDFLIEKARLAAPMFKKGQGLEKIH
jgi:hypothetical protein